MTTFVRLVRLLPLVALVGLSCSSIACGSSQRPLRIKASDPSTFALAQRGQPIIVELAEGDAIPLSLVIQGDLFETRPDPPPILLVAKRRFFVRIDGDGVRTSPDGEHWNASRTKGSFSIGLDFQPSGTSAHVRLVTPSYDAH